MSDLVERAIRFATEAHQRIEHRRGYSGQCYTVHLREVALIVESVTDDPEMIAAAWLHDVVEDTPTTLGDVKRTVGFHGVAHIRLSAVVAVLTVSWAIAWFSCILVARPFLALEPRRMGIA